jgi:acyl-CoA synthetase (AMP-forming)/AMP-acid ligase II
VLSNPSDPILSKLVAVLEVENLKPGKEKEVLSALEGRLPEYMVPSEVRSVGNFPLNTNGKIDRKAVAVLVEGGVQNTLES